MDSDDTRWPPSDPDAPPTPAEIAEAEALRDALADPSRHHAGADFARAVALAHEPRALSPQANRAIVANALVRGDVRRRRASARRTRVSLLVAGGVAMAAAVALVIGGVMTSRDAAPSVAASTVAASTIEPLVPVRSTQPLFREPFARMGGQSARIDRIATARAADLRDNRFAAWGVR